MEEPRTAERQPCGYITPDGYIDPYGHLSKESIKKTALELTFEGKEFQLIGHSRVDPGSHIIIAK